MTVELRERCQACEGTGLVLVEREETGARQFSGEDHKPDDAEAHEHHNVGDEHVLDIVTDDTDDQPCAVWLNTTVANFDGLVVAIGDSRQAAVTRAVAVLEKALEILQGPPPEATS